MQDLISKLDLGEFIAKFNTFLARPKPLFIQGDTNQHYEKILELSQVNLKAPQSVHNLDDTLMRLSKFGVLHISELYEFSKIIAYFNYLKAQNFDLKMRAYLDKIIIPEQILELGEHFSAKGELKASVDERLCAINEAFTRKKAQINELLRQVISSKSLTPYLVDTQIHYINESEALLVRGGFMHALKGQIIARSASGFFYVVPNSIEALKNELSALMDKKEELIFEYCKKMSKIFNQNLAFLKFINKAFDYIDALLARVLMAKSMDLSFVLADASKDVVLSEFAHPALSEPKRVSVEFGTKILIITGVNAGGKSMLLKSILTAAFCAKYLLPMAINAQKSKIGSFKQIDAIIEDPQSVKDDISTFAGRMQAFSALFGKKGLIIGIDEIELGTDSDEAATLYSVIISKLLANDIKMIITTHHKTLALLLSKNENVGLLAALYDEKAQRPKYEFLAGIIGKSYAFETALRYGIAANIIAQAKQVYGENKQNLNDAITKAINLELELKQKIAKNDAKSIKLDELILSLKDEKERQNETFQGLLNKLEREYYFAINEAKKAAKLKDVKDAQRAINKANDLIKAINKPQTQAPQPLNSGDSVKYGKIKAKLLALNKNEATIDANGIKMRVPLNALTKGGISADTLIKNAPKTQISVQKPQNASVMLDLHGLRADEAIEKLDRFISNALIMGFDEVLIKHGIGTGRLAYVVKEFLKSHPSVKSFSDASPNEGGFGAKIVKL